MPFVKVMDAASRGRGKGCLPSRPARQSDASNTGARDLGDGFIFFLNRRDGQGHPLPTVRALWEPPSLLS